MRHRTNLTFEEAWEEEDPCHFQPKWKRQSSYISQELLKTRCGLVSQTSGLVGEVRQRQEKKKDKWRERGEKWRRKHIHLSYQYQE